MASQRAPPRVCRELGTPGHRRPVADRAKGVLGFAMSHAGLGRPSLGGPPHIPSDMGLTAGAERASAKARRARPPNSRVYAHTAHVQQQPRARAGPGLHALVLRAL